MNIRRMDCTWAAETLPWYLNGTLDADETRNLEAHLESCPVCRQEHRETAFAAAAHSAHPPAEELVDFVFHRLALSSRRGVVERHLKACPTCALEVRLAEASRDTLAELDAEGADEPARTPPQAVPVVRQLRPRKAIAADWWRSAALAASLAAIIGAGFWLWNLEPGSVDLAQGPGTESGGEARASVGPSLPQLPSASPQGAKASLVSIHPGALTVGAGAGGVDSVELPSDAQELRITLLLPEATVGALLELQVLNVGDRVVWRGGVLRPAGDGLFTATLPLEFLPRGACSLRVRQRDGDRSETLAILPIELIRH